MQFFDYSLYDIFWALCIWFLMKVNHTLYIETNLAISVFDMGNLKRLHCQLITNSFILKH